MLLRLRIMPWFGDLTLDGIGPVGALVAHRSLRQGRSESTAARSYRLLRAILNTAVKDDRRFGKVPAGCGVPTRSRHLRGRRRK
jgi:hypothetical protein